jgi:hypothetical protein
MFARSGNCWLFMALFGVAFALSAHEPVFAKTGNDGDEGSKTPRTPYEILDSVKRAAGKTPDEQSLALARVAWSGEYTDPAVRAAARDQLVSFGQNSMRTIRDAVHWVDPVYSADVAAALVQSMTHVSWGQPEHYLPGLEELIWFGSIDAKRIAILEITRFHFGPALMTIADAGHFHPELLDVAVWSLGAYGNDKARHFLGTVMREGDPARRRLAALALAQIGQRAKLTLKDAALGDDADLRHDAIRALLPITDPDDLTALYEFLGRHGDDKAQIVQRVRDRIGELEEFLDVVAPPPSDDPFQP